MRVLVIDDDADILALLRRFFEGRGYVVETRSGALGLPSRVASWWRGDAPPDAIIVDLMMPTLSGDGALKLLARNSTSRRIPVVLYSAGEAKVCEEAAKSHPLCAFVPKSQRLSALAEELEGLMASAAKALARETV